MTVDIGSAIEGGFDRVTAWNGILIAGILVLVNLVQSVIGDSLLATLFVDNVDYQSLADVDADSAEQIRQSFTEQFPLAILDVALPVLAVLWLVLFLVGLAVQAGVIRTFTSDEREQLPAENFTDDILLTVLNLAIGTLAYAIIVGIGLLFLILPGIYLAVALFFYNYEIIVEGKNFVDALSESWSLTEGDRMELFGLGFVMVLIGGFIGGIAGFLFTLVASGATVLASVGTTMTSSAP